MFTEYDVCSPEIGRLNDSIDPFEAVSACTTAFFKQFSHDSFARDPPLLQDSFRLDEFEIRSAREKRMNWPIRRSALRNGDDPVLRFHFGRRLDAVSGDKTPFRSRETSRPKSGRGDNGADVQRVRAHGRDDDGVEVLRNDRPARREVIGRGTRRGGSDDPIAEHAANGLRIAR